MDYNKETQDALYEALRELVETYDKLIEAKRLGMPPEFGTRMCKAVKALAKIGKYNT